MFGVHLSLPQSIASLPLVALQYDTKTFQCFLRNNRNMKCRQFNPKDLIHLGEVCNQNSINQFVVHAPYSMNLATSDEDKRSYYASLISEDLLKMEMTDFPSHYVLHPGSHLDLRPEEAMVNVATCVKLAHSRTVFRKNTTIALETMAGAGTQLLRSPEQCMYLLQLLSDTPGISLCFDTCHVFAAGYDICQLYDMMKESVSVVHLNNSQANCGTRVDRHANLKSGCIPLQTLKEFYRIVIQYSKDVPVILETPGSGVLEDIMLLQEWTEEFS